MAFKPLDILDSAVDTLTSITNNISTGNQPGIQAGSVPTASGNSLPSSQIQSPVSGTFKRNIIHWFIPQMGIVQMYVNPEQILYRENKLITPVRTKGGFTVQYWGEELGDLQINGTTGSSGIEGINVLREIYRAEQYAFDTVGLSLASQASSNNVQNNPLVSDATQLTSLIPGVGGQLSSEILGGLLTGADANNSNLASQQIPNLATVAFGIEMYYMGEVYHGFFKSFIPYHDIFI